MLILTSLQHRTKSVVMKYQGQITMHVDCTAQQTGHAAFFAFLKINSVHFRTILKDISANIVPSVIYALPRMSNVVLISLPLLYSQC